MTIDEAIKELQGWNRKTFETHYVSFSEALQIGIEALKWRLQIEQEDPEITLEPLPGETEVMK